LRRNQNETENGQLSTRNTISTKLGEASASVIDQLPTIKSMSRTFQWTRIIKENPPVNPSNANDLIIPEIYKFTNKNELFLSYDNGNNENRILIFTTKSNLNLLQESDNWLGDGTFKTVPSIFSQLYTIHSYKSDCVVPLVYILMTNRTKNSYIEVLRQLLILNQQLNPLSIRIDFEQPFISAFDEIFPNAVIKGCFFHFGQCVWRKIQTNAVYKKNMEKILYLRSK